MKFVEKYLGETVEFLRKNRVEHLVTGVVAGALWGVKRSTFDIDFLLKIEPGDFDRIDRILKEYLGKRGFKVKGDARVFLQGVDTRGFELDFMPALQAFQKAAFERAVRRKFKGKPYWFVAPEDLIVAKLLRSTFLDRCDILSIAEETELDLPYMKEWIEKLNLNSKVTEIFAFNHKECRGGSFEKGLKIVEGLIKK